MFQIFMAVLANAYAAPAPQFGYAHPPPPPPPPPARVHALPPPPPPAYHQAQFIPIVAQTYDANPDGSYTFS